MNQGDYTYIVLILSGAITAGDNVQRCTRARENQLTQLATWQVFDEFKIRALGGVTIKICIVAGGYRWYICAKTVYRPRQWLANNHAQMASPLGQPRRPTRFLVNCTIRYLVSQSLSSRRSKAASTLLGPWACTGNSRLYQTWTLLGRLSIVSGANSAEFGTSFWTGYEPWCAVWTRCFTADQQ